MKRIKSFVLMAVLFSVVSMSACTGVKDIVENVEEQINDIDAQIDYDFDSEEDDEKEIYPLPADLYTWNDKYVATFGNIKEFDYDEEYSDETLLIYRSEEYGETPDDIYITADEAEYVGDPEDYYREDIESFRDYVKDDEEYGEFVISKVKSVNVGDMKVSYFDVFYPAYSSYFYKTVAWSYIGSEEAYVCAEIESCVSEQIKNYDAVEYVKNTFSAMDPDTEDSSVIAQDDQTDGADEADNTEISDSDIISSFR